MWGGELAEMPSVCAREKRAKGPASLAESMSVLGPTKKTLP